jgi:hypothetical protein
MMVRFRTQCSVLLALALLVVGTAQAAKKGAITKPKLDPSAPVVDLFKGMEDKQLSTKLLQKDSKSGNLLIENLTKETITVDMPESFVGVHVLNQGGFGGGQGGGQQGGGGGGGGQSTGGGGGGQQGGGGGQNGGGGGGFFSIPPGKVVRLTVCSVCLEHGKPEPSIRMEYKIFPVEQFSQDPILKELLNLVATGRINRNVAQAAAWNIANGKSWRELAGMKFRTAGNRPDKPHFSYTELAYAQNLVAAAKQRAVDKKDKKPAEPADPVRRDRTGRALSQR